MAIYRGPGGANDGIPSSSSTEFPGDVNVAGNLHVNGDITSDGNIDGVHTGDGSGLTGVITELPTLAELGIPNHDKLTVDELGNVTVASDITVDGVLYGDGSGLTNLPIPELPDVYNKSETDALLNDKADKATTYTKTEVDSQQEIQDNAIANNTIAIQANTDAIAAIPGGVDGYTKAEIDAQQNAQDVEIEKKANKSDTYTKKEVDELIEGSSGAIVGNYTNKQANNVARDPEAGNLYLVAGVEFTDDYSAVTAIYISDTDGDGEVRDFDEVQENDKITITSENGTGEYTINTISDVDGYRELVVFTESAEGTVADDTPVQIVMDLAAASSGSGGGLPLGSIIMWTIPEVPEGWQICDGTNDTPDLRDRFVIGAGNTYALDATGGSKDAIVVTHNHSVTVNTKTGLNGTLTLINRGGSSGANSLMRARSGSVTTATSGQGSYGEGWRGEGGSNSSKATFKLDHNHSASTSVTSSGSSGTNKNLPPYYALAYIMKV